MKGRAVLEAAFDHDVVIVGSGFGGSVAALRLAEKGYDVSVVESGRRFADHEFAETSWNLRRFLWAPRLGLGGVQRVHWLRRVIVLAGAGVGGGSLNYGNAHYVPPVEAFSDPQWASIGDWRAELAPYYALATRMLGTTPVPRATPADEVMRDVAREMGRDHTFRLTDVGVWFGRLPGADWPASASDRPAEEAEDPYFGGAGPRRRPCRGCGNCMVGCRHGAKNTLVKNYLYLAERLGVRILADTTVTAVRPRAGGGYDVELERTGAWIRRGRRTVTANQVVVAAGTWGTQALLHRMKATGALPHISDRLGEKTRTNSEALVGAMTRSLRPAIRLGEGVAISSSFHPDDETQVENVRYGSGSNAMGLLSTLLADGGGPVPRWLRFIGHALRHPRDLAQSLSVWRWSDRTIIALVMQHHDNSLTVSARRGWFGRWKLTSRPGHGEPNPTWIPIGHDVIRRVARRIEGVAGGSVGDVANVPMTAHFLGGCSIGDSASTGVIDAYHRLYGHPGLHVVDGSTVSANLGVNPSLTITAQAERAMAFWPVCGQPDQRPRLGSPYARIEPVRPVCPAARYDDLGFPVLSGTKGQTSGLCGRPGGWATCVGRNQR